MGTTPTYAWPYPEPTDPVANGAQDIEDLALAVETTVSGLISGGVVPIASSTFSTVASASIDNCFTSTYTNYLITFKQSASSTSSIVTMRLRVGGVDNSGIAYTTQRVYGYSTTVVTDNNPSGADDWYIFGTDSTFAALGQFTMTLFDPAVSGVTTNAITDAVGHPTVYARYMNANHHSPTTAYDGFTVLTTAGTFSGTINVYGLVNP